MQVDAGQPWVELVGVVRPGDVHQSSLPRVRRRSVPTRDDHLLLVAEFTAAGVGLASFVEHGRRHVFLLFGVVSGRCPLAPRGSSSHASSPGHCPLKSRLEFPHRGTRQAVLQLKVAVGQVCGPLVLPKSVLQVGSTHAEFFVSPRLDKGFLLPVFMAAQIPHQSVSLHQTFICTL